MSMRLTSGILFYLVFQPHTHTDVKSSKSKHNRDDLPKNTAHESDMLLYNCSLWVNLDGEHKNKSLSLLLFLLF